MPEGPEVRTLVKQLEKNLLNQLILGTESKFFFAAKTSEQCKWTKEYNFPLGYFYLREINCKGKLIWCKLELENGTEKYYLCHLGMTGGFTNSEVNGVLWSAQTTNQTLWFYDHRKFGKFLSMPDWNTTQKELEKLGTDILISPPSEADFLNLFLGKRKNICAILMDQSVLCGIGNYIKNEALYAAKINPLAAAKDIPKEALLILRLELLRIAQKSLEMQGATLSTFRNIDDKPGEFQTLLQIYKKKNDPLGNKIQETKTPDQRTTYWVKEIQTVGV
jgi:formamidopyrimidine-DNA glycosylase